MKEIATNLSQNEDGLWVSPDQKSVSYPSAGNETYAAVEDGSFWFNHRNDVITSLVRAFSPESTVFDIGGGNGFVAMALQRAGIDAVLVEPGPQGARNAKARGLDVVVQSTLEGAGFKRNSIAAAGAFDVLEHIEDDREFLGTLHRSLSPGGYLYLTVPAFDFLWSIDDDDAGHHRRYTARTLTSTLEAAGLTVRYYSYLFAFLVPPVFLVRTVPSRLGFRREPDASTTSQEHAARKGILGSVLDACRTVELKRIEGRKRIPVGTSCVAVAQKAG